MFNLKTKFNEEEEKELSFWRDDNLIIYSNMDFDCYILNEDYGKFTYEECFGETSKEKFKDERYEKVIPNRIIQYMDRYIMEETGELGHWFLGWKQSNGNLQFLAGTESLSDAFDSL